MSVLIVILLAGILVLSFGTLYFMYKRLNWLQHVALGDQSLVQLTSSVRQQTEARAYLSHLLQIDEERLPPMGGWAASADFLVLLAEHVLRERPAVVVEFGSGMTTLVIQRCLQLVGSGKLLTYENEPFFARVVEARAEKLGLVTDIHCVGLQEHPGEYHGRWYAADAPATPIDLLVIDGPTNSIHPQTRGGAARYFKHLAPGGFLFLDDARRPGEVQVVKDWKQKNPEIQFNFIDLEKGAVVGTLPATVR